MSVTIELSALALEYASYFQIIVDCLSDEELIRMHWRVEKRGHHALVDYLSAQIKHREGQA
jgi:hypothetical protein